MIRGDWRDVIEVADNLEELAKCAFKEKERKTTVNSVNPSVLPLLIFLQDNLSLIFFPQRKSERLIIRMPSSL